MSLDLTKSAAEILLQQINADLGTSFTADQVTFGPVMKNMDADSGTFEAAVQITGVPGVGPNGTVVYKYNRIDLSSIFNGANSSYSVDGGITYAQLLANINAAIGTNMSLSTLPDNDTNQLYVQGDVTPTRKMPFPAPGKTSVQFILTADPNSLIYKGEAMLTAVTAKQSLASYFTAPSTGLAYTAPA
jgi:hypothetical protein